MISVQVDIYFSQVTHYFTIGSVRDKLDHNRTLVKILLSKNLKFKHGNI